MMSPVLAMAIGIVVMLLLIIFTRMHAFPALIISAVLIALLAMPVGDVINTVTTGFGNTMKSIGIVIGFGCIMGIFLEKSGAAKRMALTILKLVGVKNCDVVLGLTGFVVSIPVFCDSGFVILNPIRKALVSRTGESSVAMSVGLGTGLYLAHVFIPPTPGPIAAANTLGVGNNLLMVMGFGVICSIFPLIAGYFYANYIGKKVRAADEADAGEVTKTYEELVAEYGKLPGGWDSMAPIIVPIILMALSSISSMAGMTGIVKDILTFLGTPIIALAVGTIFAVIQLRNAGKMGEFYNLTNETLKTVGPILFVTAAGGVLGKVIASSDMVNYITEHATVLEAMGIFFPFILSAILKSAQGSSTVALTTTAGIVAPLLPLLGLDSPVRTCLACMAIGAGAMTVSHANDSFFWVVTNFGAMTPDQGYKTQTMNTLILGVSAMIEIFILSLFLH
jgi:GntP family gluconate:H+ symporter